MQLAVPVTVPFSELAEEGPFPIRGVGTLQHSKHDGVSNNLMLFVSVFLG